MLGKLRRSKRWRGLRFAERRGSQQGPYRAARARALSAPGRHLRAGPPGGTSGVCATAPPWALRASADCGPAPRSLVVAGPPKRLQLREPGHPRDLTHFGLLIFSFSELGFGSFWERIFLGKGLPERRGISISQRKDKFMTSSPLRGCISPLVGGDERGCRDLKDNSFSF